MKIVPHAAVLAAFAAAMPLAAAAAPASPSAILENPAQYEGKQVEVSGTVSHLQVNKSMFKTVTGFQLCDSKCVVVIDQTNAARHDGETATVSGVFQSEFKGPKRTFKNVVLIK